MVDALAQAEDSGSRQAALMHFVERGVPTKADALRRALTRVGRSWQSATGWRA